jgi:hypothetical protein
MKNFIVIDTELEHPIGLRWGYNNIELTRGLWLPHMEIPIDECDNDNTFWIENHSEKEYEINDVTMYGFGQNKIKYWGKFSPFGSDREWNSHILHSKGRWRIDWNYPTFTWLHHSLGMGWLVKPAD